jgi:hypothetical protein
MPVLANGGRFEDPPRRECRPSREHQDGLRRGAVGAEARSDRRALLFRIAMAGWSVSRGGRPMMRAIARGIGSVCARAAALHQWTHREHGGPHLRTQQQECQPTYDGTCHARMRSAPTIVTTWRAVNCERLRAAQLAPAPGDGDYGHSGRRYIPLSETSTRCIPLPSFAGAAGRGSP